MRKAFSTLLAAFLLVFGFFLLASPSYVQAAIEEPIGGGGSIPEVVEWNEAVENSDVNSQSFTFTNWENLRLSIAADLMPGALNQINPRLEENSLVRRGGAYGTAMNMTKSMISNPPANTGTYVADTLKNMNLGVEPAYAQGIGFSSLQPILETWKIMRNISYFIFIIVFVALGFMIMFRQKIGGQAAVTAQQAIPRVIVALLMVTFSYAIAGLLIDLMYLSMFTIAGLFQNLGGVENIKGNPFSLAGELIGAGAAKDGAAAIGNFVDDALNDGIVGELVKIVSNLTAGLIIILVLVFNAFKLFFKLLRVYVELIIQIVFSPLILMMNAIPGRNSFATWIRSLVANLAVFPTILILVILFKQLKESVQGAQGGFNPPYVSGVSGAEYIPFLAGLALILALPEAIDQIRKALGAQEGGMFGSLMGTGVSRLKQTAIASEAGIPLSAGLYGAQREFRAANQVRREEQIKGFGNLYNLYVRGKTKSGDYKGGGIAGGFERGASAGQSVRNVIDAFRDGTIINPDRQLQALRNISQKAQSPQERRESQKENQLKQTSYYKNKT